MMYFFNAELQEFMDTSDISGTGVRGCTDPLALLCLLQCSSGIRSLTQNIFYT